MQHFSFKAYKFLYFLKLFKEQNFSIDQIIYDDLLVQGSQTIIYCIL